MSSVHLAAHIKGSTSSSKVAVLTAEACARADLEAPTGHKRDHKVWDACGERPEYAGPSNTIEGCPLEEPLYKSAKHRER